MGRFADIEDAPTAPRTGAVYWITGLAGAGKTTLAHALTARLRAAGRPAVRLDGDQLRPILGARYSYGQADRRAMAMTYARLCHELAKQGLDVVCATVSMVHEARRWARAAIPDYREIYLRATPELISARHPRGLIAAARAGRLRNVPGVDLPVEEPETPDVVIEDDGRYGADQIAALTFAALWPSPRADGP